MRDVLVIGGGIMGCSTAYYLARAGRKVTLIDRGGIGEGTSGACDGMVFLQTKKPGLPLRMAMRSADIYEGLASELGYETQFERCGGMIPIETEEMRRVMEPVVAAQIRDGMDVEFLDNAGMRKIEPLFASDLAGAVYSKLDGITSPIYTTRAFAKRLRELGGEIVTHAEVTAVHVSDGAVKGVSTTAGEFTAGTVVLCTGVWTKAVGRMAGLEIPIRPRRGHLLVSEAVEKILHVVVTDARYIATKHDPSLIEKSTDPTMHLGVSLSFEQTENGNFLIGSNREFAGFNLNPSYDIVNAISQYSSRFVPALAGVNIIRIFVGMRPYCEDGYPVVGPVPGIAGLYVAAGHEGDGIALAPVTGEVMADLVCGKTPEFDVSPFSPGRFTSVKPDQSGKEGV